MPTPNQIKVIHDGKRSVGLNESQYRLLLKNVAGVESSKQLDNRGVEDVLAVFEDLGFDSHPAGRTYWRDKVARRREHGCPERMAHKIHAFALPYPLAALVRRMSGGRTDVVEELDAHEAYNLIEAAKAIVARREHEGTDTGPPRTAGGPV